MSAKDFSLTKVVGTANPADMLTKYLAQADLEKHLEFIGLILWGNPPMRMQPITCDHSALRDIMQMHRLL